MSKQTQFLDRIQFLEKKNHFVCIFISIELPTNIGIIYKTSHIILLFH